VHHVLTQRTQARVPVLNRGRRVQKVGNHAAAGRLPARALHGPRLVHHRRRVVKRQLLVQRDGAQGRQVHVTTHGQKARVGVAAARGGLHVHHRDGAG